MKNHKSNWFKGNTFIIALLSGSVVLLLLFVFVATLSGAWPSSQISAQIMAALAGAVVTAIITMFLLLGQTSSEEKKERHAKIFEEKLLIYNGFLQKLCEVVNNLEISKQEEIELEFQVARIAMHTSSESINQVSEQVSKIIAGIKTQENQNGEMLTELFEIADTFYKELYGQENEQDDTRNQTIDNFRMILLSGKEIEAYKKNQRFSGKDDLLKRTKQIKALIPDFGADASNINGRNALEYRFYTDEDRAHCLIARLFPDTKKKAYSLLFQKSAEERNQTIHLDSKRGSDLKDTVKMANEIWPENKFETPLIPGCRETLLYKEIPFSESNEVIAKEIDILLSKIREYRDKHYSQQ
jgi:hypothetical protein